MTIIISLLILLLFSQQVDAKGFSYQFILADNSIDFNYLEKVELNLSDQESQNFLSFEYKLEKYKELPVDLPLFLITFDGKVVFSADASMADGLFHQVELDLSESKDHLPIFYQSSYLNDFKLSLENLSFTDQPSLADENTLQIKDLNVIRERDQSLSVIFSLEETVKNQHYFQLFCIDEQGETYNSTELSSSDNFLWSNFLFTKFFTNQKNELIFHLAKFDCSGVIYVLVDSAFKSDQTSIIEVGDL